MRRLTGVFFVSSMASAVALLSLGAAVGAGELKGKKIIKFGWDDPTPAYVRDHIRQMEKRPFDGVVIGVPWECGSFTGGSSKLASRHGIFRKQKLEPKHYEHAIEDLKATKFIKFTHNFILVVTSSSGSGDVDWFDDKGWEAIIHNVRCMARVAKQGGCAGILLDTEHYGHSRNAMWAWKEKLADGSINKHSLEETRAKAMERGGQLIRAVNAEFPDIHILSLFGPSSCIGSPTGLLATFFEGMAKSATPKTLLIDGYEGAYGFKSAYAFKKARDKILNKARDLFADKAAFRRHIRAGFPVFIDRGSNRRGGWFPSEPDKNYYSPQSFQTALHNALKYSDGYVWIYSERMNWWTGENIGKAYEAAIRQARLRPGRAEYQKKRSQAWIKNVSKAAEQSGYADKETFGELLANNEVILDLPKKGWRFQFDPSNVGVDGKWFASDADTLGWRPIEIGKFWEEQGYDYDGMAWYRLRFRSPAIASGRKVLLAVGAADESAWVWINGKPVGKHDVGQTGWDKLFVLDVTEALQGGDENLIAIRVRDTVYNGGLWKSIKLVVPVGEGSSSQAKN